MAKGETDVVHAILVDSAPFGARLFKNIRGGAYPVGAVNPLLAAIMRADWKAVKEIARTMRMIMMGLQAPGASDLIGGTPVVITQEMVGTTLCVLTVIEVKTETGTTDRKGEQLHFVDVIRKMGGFAGVARSPEDARKIMRLPPK